MNDKKSTKIIIKYRCEECNYNTSKKTDYTKHLSTDKHKTVTNSYKNETNIEEKQFICNCGKSYKHRQNLYSHKKKCNFNYDETNDNYKGLVMKLVMENQEIKTMMLNENQELKKQIIAQNKQITEQNKQITDIIPKIGNNNNNITNKNKFNINLFLNEKCKDAISMDQFIDKIEVTMKNLLTTKDKGLGAGLSNIILDNMEKLSLYERPMHCTD